MALDTIRLCNFEWIRRSCTAVLDTIRYSLELAKCLDNSRDTEAIEYKWQYFLDMYYTIMCNLFKDKAHNDHLYGLLVHKNEIGRDILPYKCLGCLGVCLEIQTHLDTEID